MGTHETTREERKICGLSHVFPFHGAGALPTTLHKGWNVWFFRMCSVVGVRERYVAPYDVLTAVAVLQNISRAEYL